MLTTFLGWGKQTVPVRTNPDYFRLCDLLGCGADGAGGWEGLTAGCQSQGSRGRSREAGGGCGGDVVTKTIRMMWLKMMVIRWLNNSA